MVAFHDLGDLADRLALGAPAGEVPRDAERRLLPDQGRGRPAGAAHPGAGPARSPQARVMESAGLWMLLSVAIVLLATGLPAFAVLMGVSALFATVGALTGSLEFALLSALPTRIIGLLETDLLQALPLYVFMGALLNRLPIADRLFRCGVALGSLGGGRSGGAPAMATLGLGALLAPMNGSVGASVAMLARGIAPKLAQRGMPAAESTALVCVAS